MPGHYPTETPVLEKSEVLAQDNFDLVDTLLANRTDSRLINDGFPPGPDYKTDKERYAETDDLIRQGKLKDVWKRHPDNPNREKIDPSTGWSKDITDLDSNINANTIKAEEVKSLWGIPYNQVASRKQVLERAPFIRKSGAFYIDLRDGGQYTNILDIPLKGDALINNFKSNMQARWDWLGRQGDVGKGVQDFLQDSFEATMKAVGWTFESIEKAGPLHPGWPLIKAMEGLDNAITYGSNFWAMNIDHQNPTWSKIKAEIIPELLLGGKGYIKQLSKFDDLRTIRNFHKAAKKLPDGSIVFAGPDGRLIRFNDPQSAGMFFAMSNHMAEGSWEAIRKAAPPKYTDKLRKAFGSELDTVEAFERAAYSHRLRRVADGKKNLMKDFIFDGDWDPGTPFLVAEDGTKYIMTRKSKPPIRPIPGDDSLENLGKAAHPSNYQLTDFEDYLRKKARGLDWTPEAKDLRKTKSELNKISKANEEVLMEGLRKLGVDEKFYGPLMWYGDRAYLEHVIAKGDDWFWEAVGKNDDFARWLPSTQRRRNDIGNLRLLFNESMKEMKDSVERRIKYSYNKKITDNAQKIIVSLEEPYLKSASGAIDFAKRSNPGNLAIREAGSGKVLGYIPDYLQEMWTTKFKQGFDAYKTKLTKDSSIFKMPGGREISWRVKPGENYSTYRRRIRNELIDAIISDAGKFDSQIIQTEIIKQKGHFYGLFEELFDMPQQIRDHIGNASKPWNK